jgi:hypothetical protein
MIGLSSEVDTRCAFGLKSAVALGFCRIDYLGCLASGLSYPVRACLHSPIGLRLCHCRRCVFGDISSIIDC